MNRMLQVRKPDARALMWMVLFCSASSVGLAKENGADTGRKNFCTKTSNAALEACEAEAEDDRWIAIGNCQNVSSQTARRKCLSEADSALAEAEDFCGEQFTARQNVCKVLGEAPYDPQILPEDFVDPAEIGDSVEPNRYLPLIPGRSLVYKNGTETITVSVTGETKEIAGVTCAVVHDLVEDNGEVIEDTIDWYAQDKQGNVWYFGEIVKNFQDGELVDLAGSWKAGVDGAKPGIVMKANPIAKTTYRQEFFLGDAEDLGKVLSVTESAQTPVASCNGDCLLTRDFTPLEPEHLENKYYAPDVGFILEVDPATGERGAELVEIQNP